MTKAPNEPYERVVAALQRDGWVVVRQRGSHVRLQKRTRTELLKITMPAHRPVKRPTLAHILKHAQLTVDEFNALLGMDHRQAMNPPAVAARRPRVMAGVGHRKHRFPVRLASC